MGERGIGADMPGHVNRRVTGLYKFRLMHPKRHPSDSSLHPLPIISNLTFSVECERAQPCTPNTPHHHFKLSFSHHPGQAEIFSDLVASLPCFLLSMPSTEPDG